MDREVVPFFFVVSIIGFDVSLFALSTTFLGLRPDLDFVNIWVLVILILTIWTQPIFRRNDYLSEDECSKDEMTDIWSFVFNNSPRWLKLIYGLAICYVLFNLLKWLSPNSFDSDLYQIRMVTSYCLSFYFITLIALFKEMRHKKI